MKLAVRLISLLLALALPAIAWAALSPSQTALRAKMRPDARFLLEKVTFKGATTTLEPASNKVLLDLAQVVKAHPEARLRLEVFVDPTDPDPQGLSDKRAEIILARIKGFGAPAGTVEAVGLAGTEVLVPSIVEGMKQKNRRVMVRVLVPYGAKAPVVAATPTPARTAVAIATPFVAPTPISTPFVAPTPIATPYVAPTPMATPVVATTPLPGGRARVTLVSTKTTPTTRPAAISGAMRTLGAELVRTSQVKETRPVTTVYFTPQFEAEARRLASTALPTATRLVAVLRIDPRTDLLVVLGAEPGR